MDFKPHEIALAIVALAAPSLFLVLAFIPGGLNFIGDIAMDPVLMPWIFFGGAGLLFCLLAYRIYRRIRPRTKVEIPEPEHITPTPRFTLKRESSPPSGPS